jgi:hypothetical protein
MTEPAEIPMLQRVARAIFEGNPGVGPDAWDELGLARRRGYLRRAAKVLKVLEQPDQRMIEAACAARRPADIWPAMIRAASK